jgi:ribonuclease HI
VRVFVTGTNNTAELTAIGEALIWCNQFLTTSPPPSNISRIVIRYDSEYAAKSVQGIFNGKKNVELIAAVRKQYAALQRVGSIPSGQSSSAMVIDFVHVKGHSKSRWNDRADELAAFGAAGRVCSEGRYGSEPNSASALSDLPNTCVVESQVNTKNIVLKGVGKVLSKGPILGAQSKRKFHDLPDSRFSDSRLYNNTKTQAMDGAKTSFLSFNSSESSSIGESAMLKTMRPLPLSVVNNMHSSDHDIIELSSDSESDTSVTTKRRKLPDNVIELSP